MKAIITPAILTSFSSKADKSLSFRGVTPELSSIEKVAFMDLQGLNVRLLIEPMDYAAEGKVSVKNEVDSKTPSERLRGVLFCLYKHEQQENKIPKEQMFETFYADKMSGIIEKIKRLLPE